MITKDEGQPACASCPSGGLMAVMTDSEITESFGSMQQP